MTTISKSFTFEAAHFLPLVLDGHKCKRMHGHSYRVELICAGAVGPDGMVVDYAVITDNWKPLFEKLDHRVLNEVRGLENPTTEVLAEWIFAEAVTTTLPLVAVRVYESATTWCEYRP